MIQTGFQNKSVAHCGRCSHRSLVLSRVRFNERSGSASSLLQGFQWITWAWNHAHLRELGLWFLSPVQLLYREDLKNVQYMHPTSLLPSVLNQQPSGLQCSRWRLLTTWLAVMVLLFIYLIVYIHSRNEAN